MKHLYLFLWLGLGLLAGLPAIHAQSAQAPSGAHPHGLPPPPETQPLPPRLVPWPKDLLETAARLPVQDGGRVKPLSTFANFSLLRINGKRTAEDERGERLGAMEWLLDVLVDPERASRYPVFQVQDSAAVHAIGLSVSGKERRDRWTYNELRPGLGKLFELAHEYSAKDSKARSSLEQQVVQLAESVDLFLSLAGFLDFARADIPLRSGGGLATEFGSERLRYSTLVERAPEIPSLANRLMSSTDPLDRETSAELGRLLQFVGQLGRASMHLALQPPDTERSAREAWHTPGELLTTAFDGTAATPVELEALMALEDLGASLGADGRVDMDKAGAAIAALGAATKPLAAARGETRWLELEVTYYRLKLLHYGLAAFVLAFLFAAFSWLRPTYGLLPKLCFGGVVVGTLLVTAAIVLRCIIRERPPVSTLYETLLFVTAVGAIIGIGVELIHKRRIALYATAALGMIGLFLSNGYETLDKRDTMPSLVAVLDTNFWLATHVTTIVIGYAAGMFAALLASVYLVMRLLRSRAAAPETFSAMGRMIYGTVCFALIFSLVGTILGGIWANDSWGRFWGWDPKENGALLICICQVAILHARLGGYLKELGIAVWTAFGGTVVAFSWFGTNLLGVGLHSYGFTSGINSALWTYYGLQWGICAIGLVIPLREAQLASRRSTLRASPASGAGETATGALGQ